MICGLKGIFEKCSLEATSEEHIIPNAIGGRLKRVCLCRNCNTKAGDQWDSGLAKQLNLLSILFSVARERGDSPNEMILNNELEKILFREDGTIIASAPKTNITEDNNGEIHIEVQSASSKTAKQIISGFLKKENLYAKSEIEYREELESYSLDFSISFDFTDESFARSLVKMAYLYAYSSGIEGRNLDSAFAYLDGESKEHCFGPCYKEDLVINRPEEVPIHVVVVKCCAINKIVYGYLELFGFIRVIVKLGDYIGRENLMFKYFLDPTTGEELNIDINLDLTIEEVNAILKPQRSEIESFNILLESKFNLFIKKWNKKRLRKAIEWASCKASQELNQSKEENIQAYIFLVYKNLSSLNIFN
ncbi:HNH endonuclease [uncultured Acinetobacter sp.]|uniref:HNH endonuclease n=1 Tax=uncultured Acinetobacter sp. TaxID=165433 RepID=UPI003749FCC6